jgi:hypothetical protein
MSKDILSYFLHLNYIFAEKLLDIKLFLYNTKINSTKKETPKSNPQLDAMLSKHTTVFDEKLGEVKGVTAKFNLQENSQPKYIKTRTVAYSLRSKVEKELVAGGLGL